MSSTNQPKRSGLDAYYTPDAVAQALVARLRGSAPATVLEPSVGGGAFLRAVASRWPGAQLLACDVNPDATGLADPDCVPYVGDFVDLELPRVDLVVGNPPFNAAEAHVRRALALSTDRVAMLLRLAFLETAKRRTLWQEHPAARVDVLVSRPSFTGQGTDSAAYGWFVWDRRHEGPPVLGWADWKGAR